MSLLHVVKRLGRMTKKNKCVNKHAHSMKSGNAASPYYKYHKSPYIYDYLGKDNGKEQKETWKIDA